MPAWAEDSWTRHGAGRAAKGPGVRLVQAAFHNRSLALYAKLGFGCASPWPACRAKRWSETAGSHRTAANADIAACNRVCSQVHGHDRGGELSDAIRQGTATVVEHQRRISGYASIVGFFGHAVGSSNADLQALIGGAKGFAGSGFLLPSRNAELLHWCLAHGLRMVQPMTLMSVGLYNQPAGAFLSSITY